MKPETTIEMMMMMKIVMILGAGTISSTTFKLKMKHPLSPFNLDKNFETRLRFEATHILVYLMGIETFQRLETSPQNFFQVRPK